MPTQLATTTPSPLNRVETHGVSVAHPTRSLVRTWDVGVSKRTQSVRSTAYLTGGAKRG